MQTEIYKSAVLPLVAGLLLIGLNFLSERWATSQIGPIQDLDISTVPCGEGETCTELDNNEQLTQLISTYDAHHYFPSELLLLSMILVGVIISFQKSGNPYVVFLVVASILGLIRGIQTLNVYSPLVYFVVIGVGFGLSSVALRYIKSA